MTTEFRWVLPGLLAGAAQPGLFRSIEEDFQFLTKSGIHLVVTLTESPLDVNHLESPIRIIHFPISDMGIPTPRAAAPICTVALERMHQNQGVLFHCRGGAGRTGTMLACCLVSLGRTPQEAIQEVRRANPAYLQTAAQERFITHYAEFLNSCF